MMDIVVLMYNTFTLFKKKFFSQDESIPKHILLLYVQYVHILIYYITIRT